MADEGNAPTAPAPSPAPAAGEGGGEVAPAPEVTVHIRTSNGPRFSVQTALDVTVAAFKAALAEKCDVLAEQQRLIYKGRILKDDLTLQSYGLESDHTIHLVRGAPPLSAPDANASKNGSSRSSSNASGAGRGIASSEGGGLGGTDIGGLLFPGLGGNGLGGSGAPGLFGIRFPDIEQIEQQLAQNPNMMRDIMNMPAVQNLMNNPEVLRSMLMNNPQMREIIDRNPDVAHVLNDPSSLRQSLEVMRNPELMREMMRNTDRAMSNIESSPEGFNMLRRMYENVQEPFLNAATMAGNTGNDLGSNPFAALLGGSRNHAPNSSASSDANTGSTTPNSNPLPNPWGSAGAQSTNPRQTPATNASSHGIGGLGGFGLPELERMAGGMPDPSVLNQILQNPTMVQLMQSLLSNPQIMNQVLSPQLGEFGGFNSQMREMLQNPELLRQLTSPETLQQLLTLQQSILSQLGHQPSSQEQNQTSGNTGALNNTQLNLLMNMFSNLGGLGGFGASNNSNVPPEELYATQLTQLQEMGFFDTQENLRALIATSGNVSAAIERLLGNFSP